MAPVSPRFKQLSLARQTLLRLCQTTNYGAIEHLLVRDREPVLDSTTVVRIDRKLDTDEHPRRECESADFLLCAEAVRLMMVLDSMNSGKISSLEVRAGIPRRVVCEHRLSDIGRGSPQEPGV